MSVGTRVKRTGPATYPSHYFSVRPSFRIIGRFCIQPSHWEYHFKTHLDFPLVVFFERYSGGLISGRTEGRRFDSLAHRVKEETPFHFQHVREQPKGYASYLLE
jgi:hypothetical protein